MHIQMSPKKDAKLQIADFQEGNSSDKRHILIVESLESKKAVTINSSVYTIGRHPGNALVFHSKQVSRCHATILWLKSAETHECAYWILDGDINGKPSLNGVLVNGKRNRLQILNDGDIISIGDQIKIRYSCLTNSTLNSLEEDETQRLTEQEKINCQDTTIHSSFANSDNSNQESDRFEDLEEDQRTCSISNFDKLEMFVDRPK
jgi:pSer/pThr/pTyr-binding forkhead associated (FHA) protein